MDTSSSRWAAEGNPDPHGDRYKCGRKDLPMGNLTDDELANAAFMNYNIIPPIDKLLDGTAYSPIAWMTAVKDRLRWLSRQLDAVEEENKLMKSRLAALEVRVPSKRRV